MDLAEEPAAIETRARQQVAILMVDDYEPNLLAFEAVLAPLGHRLVRASSGDQALQRLIEEDFALILIDVMMPHVGGLETACLIRQRERSRDTPIIFVSATSHPRTDVMRGHALGAADYLVRPYDPDILRAKVEVFVELHRMRVELERQARVLRARDRERDQLQRQVREAHLARAEAESKQASYRVLAESIPQQVWAATADGMLDYVNPVVEKYVGQPAAAMLGAGWFGLLHPDDAAAALARWRRSLATGEPCEMEARLRRHDGVYRWYLGRALPERDRDGHIVRWFGTNTDIDDRKTKESELHREQVSLHEGEQRLRLALAAGQLGDWEWNIEGGAVRWSPILEQIHGLAAGSFEGTFDAYQRDIHPDDRERVLATIGRSVQGESAYELRYRIVRSDGEVRWLEARGTLVCDDHERPVRLVGVCGDITDRIARETAERAAAVRAERCERRFQLLAEAMPQIMWSMSPDGQDSYLNTRWYEYTGQDVAIPFAEKWLDAVHADDRERCLATWTAAQATASAWEMEYRLRRHDGAFRWHIARSVPQRDGDGSIVQWYGTATDIHEQRTAIRSRDDLLATVSHDLRDPLATITLASTMLQGTNTSASVDRAASLIQRGAARMEQLLRDLLDITSIESGHLSIDPAPCRVDELIEAAVSMIAARAATKQLAIKTRVASAATAVQCDKSRVLQVFANLLGNASKFTPPGGTLSVAARPEAGFVTFAVTDTGPGIEPDQLGYVFDRFWKSKDQAKAGTGLGLAICQGIVKQHGGTIWVESTLGVGTTFSFTLPIAA